jgi:hypothetical protein
MRTKIFFTIMAFFLISMSYGQDNLVDSKQESFLSELFQKTFTGEIIIVAIIAGVLILGLGIFLTMINKKVDSLTEKKN